MLNESRKNRHPCLISDFRSKAVSFFLVNIVMVVVTLFLFCMLWSLCYFEICYFLLVISSVLLSEGWWTLPKPFSVFMEKILWFLSLILLKCCLELWIIDLCMLKYHCISVMIVTAVILSGFLISDRKNFTEIFISMFIRKKWFELCSHPHPLLPTWCVLIPCKYQVSYDFITFDGKGYLSFFSGNFRCFDVSSSVNIFFH